MIKVENGVVVDTNYSIDKLKRDFNTSFKVNWDESDLAEFDVYIPVKTAQPAPSVKSKRTVRGDYVLINDVWTETWTETDAFAALDDYKAYMRGLVTAKAESLRDGGLNVAGVLYETSKDPFSLPAKASPKAQRKLISKDKQKVTLTEIEVNDLYDAIDDFIELTWDRQYDLIDLIDGAETFAALDALNIDSGWPSNGVA